MATYSNAGAIQASFRGCDTARFVKSALEELLFGNGYTVI